MTIRSTAGTGRTRGSRCHDSPPRRDPGRGSSSGAADLFARHKDRRPSAGAPVLVVFVDDTACPWLRVLRRGFRHCFVLLHAGPLWLACEPLKDRIELDALELPREFDLARFYGEQGHRVLLGRCPPPSPRQRFALAPLTCVTVVKRLLGIHAPWVWSPWQLYAHLSGPACGFRPWSESCAVPSAGAAGPATLAPNSALDIVQV
jgi:hypothetical protein